MVDLTPHVAPPPARSHSNQRERRMAISSAEAPVPMPESVPFWEGVQAGELRLQKCGDCDRYRFPPSPVCPHCTSTEATWETLSGRGRLYSYVITERPWPEWNREGPMSVALVVLEEGPKLVSTVVNCDQTTDALMIDMPLRATFERFGEETTLLCFEPDREA